METKTKIILGLVGAGVATLVIYMMARKRTAVSQMQPAVVPPVPVVNYNNSKPIMGASAFRDGATNSKPIMGLGAFRDGAQVNNKEAEFQRRIGA